VEQALFSISCTTCQARLKVRSEEAIGAILECPKCGSFVQVEPPEGWEPSQPHPNTEAAGEARATTEKNAEKAAAGVGAGAVPASQVGAGGEAASGATVSKPPPLPGPKTPPGVPKPTLEMICRRRLLAAAIPVAGVAIVVGTWFALFSGDRRPEPADRVAETPVDSPVRNGSSGDANPSELLPNFDTRWLPSGTRLLARCRPSQWADTPVAAKAILEYRDLWQPTVGRLLRGLGLQLESVEQLTWAAADLAAWPERCVVIVQLTPDHDAALLANGGEPVDVALDGAACRRLDNPHWPHPFAVVNPRVIVTGDLALLRELADRTDPALASRSIERLLDAVSPGADATLLLDLTAARGAGWKLPTALFDVWPEGERPWRVLWDVPGGVGCSIRYGDRPDGRAVFVCEGPTAVEEVKAAVDELLPAARNALDARLASLPKRLQSGEMTAAVAASYEVLLQDGLDAAQAARSEVVEEAVVVHVPSPKRPGAVATAALDRRKTIHADWLAAARTVDETNHRRLITGLTGYAKAEGQYPPGVAGGALLAPETRLSWIASMLPYLDHSEWHRQLQFGYPWNGPQNREISAQELPEMTNPAVGPEQTEAGFPVTHYVGVAGVGRDAARLPPDDPRAGVFGYRRSARPEEIADGASNTIAVAGVTGRLGPWASGGRATVRSFTRRPYVNGPDGFGSGQPDGMLVTMADGSVRFVSQHVAPEVIEQLATANGGGETTVAALNVRPQVPPAIDDIDPPGLDDIEPLEEPDAQPAADPGDTEPPAEPAGSAVDVRPKLAMRVPAIELPEMELGQAVSTISTIAGVPISFDPLAMKQLDVSLRDKVRLEMTEATIAEILQALAAQHKLAPIVADGHVLLGSSNEHRHRLYSLKYTLSDLTGNDPKKVGEMAALVRKLVAPETWEPAGGRGTVEPAGDALKVTQTAPVHREILIFCEKLRVARGRPPRSRRNPDEFRLESRTEQAAAVLSRKVTANFHQPVPLLEVADYLARLGDVDILIDRMALGREGLSAQTPASLVVGDTPLSAALDRLAESAGVAWRVIDPATLQITSPAVIASQPELEFYRVSELLTGGRSGPGLAESLTTGVHPATWREAGGPGVIHFDEPSGCLIVLQSQPVQAEIEQLLEKMEARP